MCFTSFRQDTPYRDDNWQNGVCVHVSMLLKQTLLRLRKTAH